MVAYSLARGWGVAVTTLMNERGTGSFGTQARFRILIDRLVELARHTSVNGQEARQGYVVSGCVF